MKTMFAGAALMAGMLAGSFECCAAQVKVWEGSLSLPTYEEGSPDPNPPFDTYATNQFSYPYTLRKNLTGQKKDHAWRAVFLIALSARSMNRFSKKLERVDVSKLDSPYSKTCHRNILMTCSAFHPRLSASSMRLP